MERMGKLCAGKTFTKSCICWYVFWWGMACAFAGNVSNFLNIVYFGVTIVHYGGEKFFHQFCLWKKMANIKYAWHKCSYKSPVHCLKVASLAEVVLVWTAEPQSNNYNGYFSTNGLYLTIQSHSIPWWCFCSCLPHSIPGQKITFLEQFSGSNSEL